MAQLKLKNVSKSFGTVEVIKDVTLDSTEGEFVVFVGPSGSGKSTLLRMIAVLEDTTAGDIIIGDKTVNNLAPAERGIAMVFQSYALYPHLTVYEHIAFPLRVLKLPEKEVRRLVDRAAGILKLNERLQYKPGELSGGQRQRVAIGRAIVREPEIFLFDEPLSNLDAALRAEMRVELSALHTELGATMVYVTHDQVEAMTMADRILVLDGGAIAQIGSPLELYHKPQNTFVGSFIGNPKMNMLNVTGKSSDDKGVTVVLPDGQNVTAVVKGGGDVSGKALTLGIRPEHIRLDGPGVKVKMTPFLAEHLGIHTVSYANMDGCDDRFCTVMSGRPVLENVEIDVVIDGAHCHLFDENGMAFERVVDMSELDPAYLDLKKG